jgi:ABC-type lipoprotein export system ATPase subunit
VDCEGLVHIYRSDGLEVVALQGLDLQVLSGEMIAIVGRSGSGKTTLMNILAGMDAPTAGRVRVAASDLSRLRGAARDRYRRQVGYLWQNPRLNLVPELTALQNVQLPLLGAGLGAARRLERAHWLLGRLGLSSRLQVRPAQLSGGEQQRLCLAVAMANLPRLLLADEPTGELDTATAQAMLADLRSVQLERGTTVVMVTHDVQVERHVDRVIQIRDGRTSVERRWVQSEGSLVSDELVILDRAGRLQLPRAYVERLGLKGRVRVRLEGDHIRVLPQETEGTDEPR